MLIKVINTMPLLYNTPELSYMSDDYKQAIINKIHSISLSDFKLKYNKLNKQQQYFYDNAIDIINLLLDHQANIDQYTNEGISPFMLSILERKFVVLDTFVKKGYDLNSIIGPQKTLTLNFAIIEKDNLSSKYIIESGFNLSNKDQSGITPMYSAIIGENLNIIKLLVQKGVDINSDINSEGDKPISQACKFGKENIVKYLIENDANLNVRDNYGFSPVHDAVLYENILNLLISNGAKIDYNNYDLETPLHLASKYNKIKSCEFLIKAGALQTKNINEKDINTDYVYSVSVMFQDAFFI